MSVTVSHTIGSETITLTVNGRSIDLSVGAAMQVIQYLSYTVEKMHEDAVAAQRKETLEMKVAR